jgi:ABC-type uncharacterized transport system ATPase subunit
VGNVIETVGLTKMFGDFVANDHIDLAVRENEIKCIVGENGAGKSTLMNMLYGMLQPTSGKIILRGEETHFKSPADAISHGLGMVHQHFKLVPSLTVYENVLLGAEIHRKGTCLIDTQEEIKAVSDLIEKYKFDLDACAKVEDISVGSRQCVEILKMLYRNVDVLIMDEPTAVLTPQEVDKLFDNLRELQRQGKTIIVITHKLREVMELSDSVTVIKHGKVVGSIATKDTSQEQLAQMMVGREVVLTVHNDVTTSPSKNVCFSVKNLSTINEYGKEVLHDVSFDVHEGEVLGIAGVEGNGQTELVKVLTGLMTTTSGSVTLDGKDITNQWPDSLRSEGIAIIPEDRFEDGLCSTMSVADNCIAGHHGDPTVCKHGLLNRKAILARRDALLSKYDIRVGDIDGAVGALSGGNAQKVIIARELESSPKFLIACQPTRGVDIGATESIHEEILRFRNNGNAVLLISSELTEILGLSDRIIVMCKGQITGEVSPRDTTSTELGLLMAGIKQGEGEKVEG